MRKLIVVIVVPWTCAFGGVMSMADVSVADFPRLAGETGDSVRIMRAVDAAGRGGFNKPNTRPQGQQKENRK